MFACLIISMQIDPCHHDRGCNLGILSRLFLSQVLTPIYTYAEYNLLPDSLHPHPRLKMCISFNSWKLIKTYNYPPALFIDLLLQGKLQLMKKKQK